ncbi:TadE/TadG family type IV pilus assembly protein [Nereida sp. MMG025]|uniref:TadE/TadG family type IV pilus assembly protein n=1 Tax=Nereida sp. MMG025 TaxID=2909981 RepID=UPI001F2C52C7|nr:hypothetical protein [Nereida sp. MMG025]MCF6445125.1 hypothetical protein [Nereida sp. MMG025]
MPRITLPSLSRLKDRAKRFSDDTGGTLSVETVFAAPLLFWCIMAMFVYFEAFRTQAQNTKAAYVVADILSREQSTLTTEYINSLHQTQKYMTPNGADHKLNVTQIFYRKNKDDYRRNWSVARGGAGRHSNNSVNKIPNLPPIKPGDKMIMVEATVGYKPLFNAGITNNIWLRTRAFTRSRIAADKGVGCKWKAGCR